MYFSEAMDQREKHVSELRNGSPHRVQQPMLRRSDPNPLAHALVVLSFLGLLLAITMLSTSKEDPSKTKARQAPRQMPMVHMDR